jgi:nucleoporin SEH1
MTRVEQLDASHNDKVVALHVNFDGSRVLTASIDHRIKVWNRDSDSGELKLLDTFKAHDGDIKDVC